MGILNRFLGKKAKRALPAAADSTAKPSGQPAPASAAAPGSLEDFAQRACRSPQTITIPMLEVKGLQDALIDGLMKAYPHLSGTEAVSQASGGLSLRCPNCGQLSEQAVSYLYLAGTELTQRAVFLGPNVAALAQGRCPGCGGSTVIATFDPAKVQAHLAAAKAESAAGAGVPALATICPAVPYFGQLSVSPDENLVCCVAPDGAIVAYASGTDQLKWSLPTAAAKECLCTFVGPQRLVVVSPKQKDETLWQLVDTSDGSVVAEAPGPRVFHCAADIRSGAFFGHHPWRLEIVQTAGDKLEFSTCDPHRQLDYGPWIGPNGKPYLLSTGRVCYWDGKEMIQLMAGEHTICFEPPNRIYAGGGYSDRSGPSALRIGDLKRGLVSEMPWGREPIDEIALAGPGRLLLANIIIPSLGRTYTDVVVTLLSLASQKKEWTLTINDLAPVRSPILAAVPEHGWALIASGALLKMIALQDGHTLRALPKQRDEVIAARWLPTRKRLYVARNRNRDQPGQLECYGM
jgi:hypothetical protein